MSNNNVCIVGVNNVEVSSRLFVKLSSGEIFYFGDGITLLSGDVGPRSIYFETEGDTKDGVYRKLEVLVNYITEDVDIVESIYSKKVNTLKPVVMYKYNLDKLLRNTDDWKLTDNSYWGEYRALREKKFYVPTFPTYAKKLEDKQSY